MPGSRIVSLGTALPERIVTNDDLAAMLDTTDEWIRQRTGIEQRRWVVGDVGASELAEPAARQALARAGIEATDLDLIIFATLSPDLTFPGSSCLLQQRLDCPGVATLDIRNQCTGFVYALAVADNFIQTGFMRRILVVGAEIHSSGLEMADRGRDVTVLFGDGAGAAVLMPAEGESRILGHKLHADGRFHHLLKIDAPASRLNPRITTDMIEQGLQFPHMEGRQVFRHAVERLPEVMNEVLTSCGYTLADVDLLVPHQANLRINEMVIKKLGFPREKMISNIQRYGNTTAASIPIALNEAQEQGRLHSGNLVLLAAFGAGLTWGASLIRW